MVAGESEWRFAMIFCPALASCAEPIWLTLTIAQPIINKK
jgi:hypothetical protein